MAAHNLPRRIDESAELAEEPTRLAMEKDQQARDEGQEGLDQAPGGSAVQLHEKGTKEVK